MNQHIHAIFCKTGEILNYFKIAYILNSPQQLKLWDSKFLARDHTAGNQGGQNSSPGFWCPRFLMTPLFILPLCIMYSQVGTWKSHNVLTKQLLPSSPQIHKETSGREKHDRCSSSLLLICLLPILPGFMRQ